MIVNENGTRFTEFELWEDMKNQPYDYKKKGLVNHILSNKIYNTTNPILKFMLQYYEKSLVYCMKYVDLLNNYKNYLKSNR